MKTISILILSALALAAQTPKESIIIRVTDKTGTLTTAKITGIPASAGLEVINKHLLTQVDCAGTPQVCTPRYPDGAVQFIKNKLIIEPIEKEYAPKYPSSQTEADVALIDAKIAELQAKRKALFDAARGEK